MGHSAVNVDTVLDCGRFRGVSLVVATSAFCVLVLDGFDIQVMGVTAPVVIAEFGVRHQDLGPVLSAALIGMALGSFIIGSAGDRWGRRPALLGSTLLFGSATLVTATTSSLEMLAMWRFVTGIGLGGALPNATALIAEFTPPRLRSLAITLAIAGAPIGGMLGAALAAEIVPAHGWRALFVVGGALPLVVLIPMYRVLPESARFLAMRPGRKPQLVALLNRIEQRARFSGDESFSCDVRPHARGGLRAIFSRDLVRDTLASWVTFAANIFAVYAFANWIPTVLTSVGFDLATAVRGVLFFNLAGAIGAVMNAWIIVRLGSRTPLAALSGLAVATLLFLAWTAAGNALDVESVRLAVLTGVAVAGFAITALQLGMYAVVAHVYPTECRASGVGWALGAGRVGGILSSLAGGALLVHGGTGGFFTGVAAVMALAFASILVLRRHISRAAPAIIE